MTFNYTNGHKLQSASNTNYYIGAENGKLKGRVSADQAVEVFLADPVVQSHNWTRHSVNHIDISIAGSAEVDVPLAYGKYYDESGELVKEIPRNRFEKLHLTAAQVVKEEGQEDPLAITPADMKRARITASCNGEELDNAFYVTGFSGNAQHEGSSGQGENSDYVTSPQIRIEGSFLVAKMPREDHEVIRGDLYDSFQEYRNDIRREHLANQVEYSVSVVKPVEYWLQIPVLNDNGDPVLDGSGNPTYQQLYNEKGEKLKVKASLTFSDSFTYWDSKNECPVFTDVDAVYYYKNSGPQTNDWRAENWPAGDIARCDFSGMDFKLGGKGSAGVVSANCIEIIKMVVDEDGNPIKSGDISDASFSIYRKGVTTNPSVEGPDGMTYLNVVPAADDTVKDLNVGSYTAAPDYTGYTFLRDKNAQIGDEGVGIVHDYNVTPALYYVKEDPDSIDDKITDDAGKLWNYKDTYIVTEYAWRNSENDGSAHYSDTFTKSSTGTDAYCSSPELLGNHYGYDGTSGPYTNDFLEFYVYNVYRKIETVDVPVDKSWPDLNSSYTWSATFELEELEVLEDGSANANANTTVWRKVEGVEPITITNESEDAARTFTKLPKYRYYANADGSFSKYRIMYSVDETAYELKQSGTTVSKWDNKKGLTEGDVIYAPQWPHDAGDLDDEMHLTEENPNFYHVIVENYKKDQNVTDKLDKVTLKKTWAENVLSNAGVSESDAYATFQLKRIETKQFVEYEGYEDVDCTVTLNGQDGPLDSITVKKGAKLKINATFDTSSGSGFASFMFNNSGSENLSVSWYSGDNHVSSNSFTVTGNMMISPTEGQYYSPDWQGVLESASLVPYSSQGVTIAEDKVYSNEMHTYTLNRAGNWQEVIENLPLKAVSAVNNNSQTISTYKYYFVEIDSNPSGIYAEMTDGAGNPLGDMAHPVDVTNKTVRAENKPIPPFAVEKKWYSIEDPNSYPEIRFTLYQGRVQDGRVQQGTVFVDGNGKRYEHIPLNSINNWHWDCPTYLPTEDASGNPVGYYMMEDSSGDHVSSHGGHVLIYQNSELDGKGNVVSYGDLIDEGTGEKYDVKPLVYYNDQNGFEAKDTTQDFPKAWDGGFAGNEGTLFVKNRAPKYMQMDIKKKILQVNPADGSVQTIMDDENIIRDIVLEIQLKRRVIFEGDLTGYEDYERVPITKLDDNGKVVETGKENAVFLTDWENYGVPFMIGFDSNHEPLTYNPNNFALVKQGGFFWRIVLNTTEADQYGYAQNVGLPAYGYYTMEDGSIIPVRYRYIPDEIGVYSDLEKHPAKPEFEWFKGLQPAAWDGKDDSNTENKETYTFDPMLPNHDQDRIKNIQASDLYVEKVWEELPTNIKEIYVKLYRSRGTGGAMEDVTDDIARRTEAYNNNSFVEDSSYLKTSVDGVEGGVLVITPNTGVIHLHGLPLVYDSDNYKSNPYYYWIEEVGYKDTKGHVYTDSAKFAPMYDKWDSETGTWNGDWTTTAREAQTSLAQVSKNRIRANNAPTIDFKVLKKWYDADGNELTAPWDSSISSIAFSVTRVAQKYIRADAESEWVADGEPTEAVELTFGEGNTITVTQPGRRAQVAVKQTGGTEYTVNYISDDDDPDTIDNWAIVVDGLQKSHKVSDTELWRYSYKIGKEYTIAQCNTTISNTGAIAEGETVTITNEKVGTSLAIKKTFAGEVELSDEQKQKITFTVTGKFDGTTQTTRTFTYGKDGLTVDNVQQQTDVYKWNDGVLVIKDISAGIYTVTEQNDSVQAVFEGVDLEGKNYVHSRTFTVNATKANDPAEAEVKEGELTTVEITNTYDIEQFTELPFIKTWTNGVDNDTPQEWPKDPSTNKSLSIKVTVYGELVGEGITGVYLTNDTNAGDNTLELNPDDFTASDDTGDGDDGDDDGAVEPISKSSTLKTPDGTELPITVTYDADARKFTIHGLPKTGTATVEGVQKTGDWKYWVLEEQVSGYQVPVYRDKDGNEANRAEEDGEIINKMVTVTLPSTGGPGTTMVYTAGASLMLFAALGFVLNARKRRMGEDFD